MLTVAPARSWTGSWHIAACLVPGCARSGGRLTGLVLLSSGSAATPDAPVRRVGGCALRGVVSGHVQPIRRPRRYCATFSGSRWSSPRPSSCGSRFSADRWSRRIQFGRSPPAGNPGQRGQRLRRPRATLARASRRCRSRATRAPTRGAHIEDSSYCQCKVRHRKIRTGRTTNGIRRCCSGVAALGRRPDPDDVRARPRSTPHI